MAKWNCPKCDAGMYCVNTQQRQSFITRRYQCLQCNTKVATRERFDHFVHEYIKPLGAAKYLARSINGKRTPLHIAIAERALGKPLPKGAHVHHVDGDTRNNAPGNLVICPTDAYHSLLHVRTDALNGCGNVDWRKCVFCKTWDDPVNLAFAMTYRQTPQAYHAACHAEDQKQRNRAKRQTAH